MKYVKHNSTCKKLYKIFDVKFRRCTAIQKIRHFIVILYLLKYLQKIYILVYTASTEQKTDSFITNVDVPRLYRRRVPYVRRGRLPAAGAKAPRRLPVSSLAPIKRACWSLAPRLIFVHAVALSAAT